jgi:outer membrane murein-binding lipoprotein Lpp
MYRIVIVPLLVCALLLSGCVSYKKFEDLQLENSKLNQELLLSRQQNDTLAQDLKQFRELSDFYYQSGMQLYTEKKYGEAQEKFQTLVDRYPTSPHAAGANEKIAEIRNLALNHYQKIIKSVEGTRDQRGRIDLIDREMKTTFLTKDLADKLLTLRESLRQDLEGELEAQREISRNILIEDDPIKSWKVYRSTRMLTQPIGEDRKFFVEIYFIQRYTGKKFYKVKTRYQAPEYLSYESVTLQGQNGTKLTIDTIYPQKQSMVDSDGVTEWSDNEIAEDDKINRLAKSNSITVTFKGGNRYTFEMNEQQSTAFREVVRKYQIIR